MKKIFKRILATTLTAVMLLTPTALTGCGKKNTPTSTGKTAQNVVDESNSKIIIWSWNEEFKGMMENYYFKDNPSLKDRVEFVIVENTTYQEKLDQALAAGGSDAPDIFLMEADYIKKYANSDYTIPVSDVGIDKSEWADQYEYTVEVAKDQRNGTIKGLSWQATPGVFAYRRSIAKKYLGSDDPKEVQKAVANWDKFLETARKLKTDSNGATKIISGIDDVYKVYLNNRKKGWVVDGKLTIDPNVEGYLDFAKTLETEGLTNGTGQWTEAWNANVSNDSTLGYFMPTWGVQWVLAGNSGGAAPGEGTYGDWAICAGPQFYYWGGTWLGVSKYCDNKASAAEIIRYFTTKEASMKAYGLGNKDFVNNKKAVKAIIDEGLTFDFLGGQSHYSIFAETAPKIDTSTMTGYDQLINNAFYEQATAYSKGEKDKATAIKDFKAAVGDQFADITVD